LVQIDVSSHSTIFQELFTMKTIFKRTQTNLLIASMAAGLGVHLASQAQTADATLSITGQITASTCSVNVTDVGTSTTLGAGGLKNLNLGTITPTNAGATGNAGTALGTAQKAVAVFSLGNQANNSACSFSGNSAWDMALLLRSEQITTIGGNTFLKNSLTTNATDAVVQLTGGVANSVAAASASNATNVLTLKGDLGIGGTYASGATAVANFTAGSASAIVVGAQFMRATNNAAPSTGLFTQSIPMAIVYK
jgi:hypothetical protein